MDRGADDGVPDCDCYGPRYCVERPLGCANRATGFGEIQLPLRVDSVEKLLFRRRSKHSWPVEASLLLERGGEKLAIICCVRPGAL